MTTFWLATGIFTVLGLTPLVVATTLNRLEARKSTQARSE